MSEYTITKTEDGAYTWTATENTESGPESIVYATNDEGCGIWQNGKQLRGTSQFSIGDCAPSTRRRRVAAFMAS